MKKFLQLVLLVIVLSHNVFFFASQNANANACATAAPPSETQSSDRKVNDELAQHEREVNDAIQSLTFQHSFPWQAVQIQSQGLVPMSEALSHFELSPTQPAEQQECVSICEKNKDDRVRRFKSFWHALKTFRNLAKPDFDTPSELVPFIFACDEIERTALRYFSFYKEHAISAQAVVTFMYRTGYQAELNRKISFLNLVEHFGRFHPKYRTKKPAEIVHDLMRRVVVSIKSEEEKNREIFVDAVKSNNLTLAQQMLINKQVSVDVRDAFGCPIFLYAVAYDLRDMVDLLCKQGFNVNDHDLYGRNARLLDRDQKMRDILQRKSNQPRFNVLAQNKFGNNAFHTAACADQEFVCRALAERDSKIVFERNLKGKNALELAFENGSCSVVEYLTQYPCFSVKEHDAIGRQPMIHAFLAKKNCKKMQCSHKCLHAAMYERLESQGGRKCINEKGADGLTSLMVACREGQEEVVQAILDHGGDLTITVKGKRALLFAQERKKAKTKQTEYDRIIELLNSKGATAHEIQLQKQVEAREEKARAEAQAAIEQKQREEQSLKPQPRISKTQQRKDKRRLTHEAKVSAEKELDALVEAPFTAEQLGKIKEFEQRKKWKALTALRVDAEIKRENRELLNQAESFNTRNIKKDALDAWKELFKFKKEIKQRNEELQLWTLEKAQTVFNGHKKIRHHLPQYLLCDMQDCVKAGDYFRWFERHLDMEIASCLERYAFNNHSYQVSKVDPHINCAWCANIIDKQNLRDVLKIDGGQITKSAHSQAMILNAIKLKALGAAREKIKLDKLKAIGHNPNAAAFKPLSSIREN